MSHGDRPRAIGIDIAFSKITKTDEPAPSRDDGLTLDHLIHAQKYNRAMILEGLSAAEAFAATKEYSILLCSHEHKAIGGEALKVYGKAAGNLTLEELTLVNYHGTLSDFLKTMNYRSDTPVSYVILDPRKHVLLNRDEEGNLTVDQRNLSFTPRFH